MSATTTRPPSRQSSRTWFAHRQAYAPRTWPYLLAVCPISALVGGAAARAFGWYGLVGSFAFGLACGWYTTKRVWGRWERKHPIVPAHDYLDDMRAAARWN